MDKLLIGLIVKPQGIRGELKLVNYTDNFDAIKGLKQLYIDDVCYQVLKMRFDKEVFVSLKGVSDRNNAELFRNKQVFAEKSLIAKKQNSFFICDVIGLNLYLSDGSFFGTITDVLKAKTDIYYVDSKDGKCLFPLIKSLNAQFDIENKKLTVDKQAFLQEICYEN